MITKISAIYPVDNFNLLDKQSNFDRNKSLTKKKEEKFENFTFKEMYLKNIEQIRKQWSV